MRTLPKHISARRDGYSVRILRGGVLYQAFVGKSHPDALERAIAARDRFYRIAGEVANCHRTKGRSNTGIAGISETVKWWRNHPTECFTVNWRENARHRSRKFYYGSFRPREVALERARAFRQLKAFGSRLNVTAAAVH